MNVVIHGALPSGVDYPDQPAQFVERLCSTLGVSRTALTRSFRRVYGISMSQYHRRAKIAWAITHPVRSDVCVESVALLAGYRHAASFYEALGSLTGLTPVQIRQRSEDQVRELFDCPLSLRIARSKPFAGTAHFDDRALA